MIKSTCYNYCLKTKQSNTHTTAIWRVRVVKESLIFRSILWLQQSFDRRKLVNPLSVFKHCLQILLMWVTPVICKSTTYCVRHCFPPEAADWITRSKSNSASPVACVLTLFNSYANQCIDFSSKMLLLSKCNQQCMYGTVLEIFHSLSTSCCLVFCVQ